MRTAPENILKTGLSDGAWFAAAIALGAAWGFSVEPVRLPPADAYGLAQLKLLGWLVVAVLCMSVGVMAWLIRGLGPPDATGEGGMASNSLRAPKTQKIRTSFADTDAPKQSPAVYENNSPAEPGSRAAPAPANLEGHPGVAGSGPAAVISESKDPFLAALDYLGHAQATVRIGGILALERLVRQGGDIQVCTGTLAAYVQQRAGEDAERPNRRPGFDVVAALAVLTRLLPPGDPLRNLADLRRTNLTGLELPDADMSRFHLEHANLSGADLRGANFSGVNFRSADLRGALLAGAVFSGASLRGADLTGAVLSDDEFGAADLSMAGNISAAQLLHIRYLPACPPRLPAGMQLTNQSAAVAV